MITWFGQVDCYLVYWTQEKFASEVFSAGFSHEGEWFCASFFPEGNTDLSCCLYTSYHVSEDIPCCKTWKLTQCSFIKSLSQGGANPKAGARNKELLCSVGRLGAVPSSQALERSVRAVQFFSMSFSSGWPFMLWFQAASPCPLLVCLLLSASQREQEWGRAWRIRASLALTRATDCDLNSQEAMAGRVWVPGHSRLQKQILFRERLDTIFKLGKLSLIMRREKEIWRRRKLMGNEIWGTLTLEGRGSQPDWDRRQEVNNKIGPKSLWQTLQNSAGCGGARL